MPLRGHAAGEGNFEAIVNFKATFDPELEHHLNTASERAKYTSASTQNELIEICGQKIGDSIVKDCNNAMYFSFIADKCTDRSRKLQIALCIRFYDEKTKSLREDFLGFVQANETTGAALAQTFIEALETIGIDIQKMRGQGYDGASNMAGKHNRVQAIIRRLFQVLFTFIAKHTV